MMQILNSRTVCNSMEAENHWFKQSWANILGFMSHVALCHTTLFCHCSSKTVTGNM